MFFPEPLYFDIEWLGTCRSRPLEGETLEESGYEVICKLPWNVSEPDLFFLRMMTNLTDTVNILSQENSKIPGMEFQNIVLIITTILGFVLFGGYVFYENW